MESTWSQFQAVDREIVRMSSVEDENLPTSEISFDSLKDYGPNAWMVVCIYFYKYMLIINCLIDASMSVVQTRI